MKKAVKYYIVTDSNFGGLIKMVNDHLDDGWDVVGPALPYHPGPNDTYFMQTLAKYKDV